MMGTPMLWQGKPLMRFGKPALGPGCCCDSIPDCVTCGVDDVPEYLEVKIEDFELYAWGDCDACLNFNGTFNVPYLGVLATGGCNWNTEAQSGWTCDDHTLNWWLIQVQVRTTSIRVILRLDGDISQQTWQYNYSFSPNLGSIEDAQYFDNLVVPYQSSYGSGFPCNGANATVYVTGTVCNPLP